MKTLIIKDLARTEQLDRGAMAAVRGGTSKSPTSYKMGEMSYVPKFGSINATQDLTQMQDVVNATADGSAFLDCVTATNHTKQYGQNNITVG